MDNTLILFGAHEMPAAGQPDINSLVPSLLR